MRTYAVLAKRWDRGWELHVEGVGVTQSQGLVDAEGMARSYVTLVTGAAPNTFDIEFVPEADWMGQ